MQTMFDRHVLQPGHRWLGGPERHGHARDVRRCLGLSWFKASRTWKRRTLVLGRSRASLDMGRMFDGASAFNQDLGWCVDDAVSLEDMFNGLRAGRKRSGVVAEELAPAPRLQRQPLRRPSAVGTPTKVPTSVPTTKRPSKAPRRSADLGRRGRETPSPAIPRRVRSWPSTETRVGSVVRFRRRLPRRVRSRRPRSHRRPSHRAFRRRRRRLFRFGAVSVRFGVRPSCRRPRRQEALRPR